MTLEEHYQIEREEGRQQGRQEGLQEGRQQGHTIGVLDGKVASVDALVKSMKLSVEEACKALNVSIQEYNEAKAGK